jgi:hypothetical protein
VEPVRPPGIANGKFPGMHKRCKPSCLYCKPIQLVSLGDPPPAKKWKRPLLLVAGLALTVCTVMAMQFAWDRSGAAFFAAISTIVMLIGLFGIAVSFRGCDTCVARYLGRTL